MNTDKVLKGLDELAMTHRESEIEDYLTKHIIEAIEEDDSAAVLVLLNEMVGHCRETNQYEKGEIFSQRSVALIEDMGLKGSVHHAVTLINRANFLRAAGRLEEAIAAYDKAGEIYDRVLEPGAFEFSGLYNNLSLVYMEVPDFERAAEYQRRALAIVEKHREGNSFELAVSHTNLGNSLLQLGLTGEAEEHLREALSIYEERELYDTHYGAAVAGLGEIFEKRGEADKALPLYARGCEAIRSNFGFTDFYHRVRERYDLCKKKLDGAGIEFEDILNIKGLKLCEQYYDEVVRTALERDFPHILKTAAIGLVGEGSDCYGFDDVMSRDHDWGPAVCIWLGRDSFEKYGKELAAWYEGLPKRFKGFERRVSDAGRSRTGVLCLDDFLAGILGGRRAELLMRHILLGEKLSSDEWEKFDVVRLSCLTNGRIFSDESSLMTALRSRLREGLFPDEIFRDKIFRECLTVAQSLQYNLGRLLKRGDGLSARLAFAGGAVSAMRLCHLMNKKFYPHDKWLAASCSQLEFGARTPELLRETGESLEDEALIWELSDYLTEELYRSGFIKTGSERRKGNYLEDIAFEVEYKDDGQR